jgi:hypothetical protein
MIFIHTLYSDRLVGYFDTLSSAQCMRSVDSQLILWCGCDRNNILRVKICIYFLSCSGQFLVNIVSAEMCVCVCVCVFVKMSMSTVQGCVLHIPVVKTVN